MFRSLNLPASVEGKVYLHSLPGRYESHMDFLFECWRYSIGEIICLATLEEIKMKSPLYMQAIQSEDLRLRIRMFQIPNFGAPSDRDAFLNLIEELVKLLKSGRNLLIHCSGGIGRTGMLANGLLMMLGLSSDEAHTTVQAAQSAPETASQDQFLEWLEAKLVYKNQQG